MIKFSRSGGRLALVVLLAASAVYAAENTLRYVSQPNSKLRIEGTSSIHDWTVETSVIGGFLEADAGFANNVTPGAKLKPKVEVTIPVRQIKSDKKPMDNVMHEAMKEKQHRAIKYRLTEMSLQQQPSNPNGPYLFDTKGELTVSGVTRTNDMVVAMEKLEGNKLKFTGTNSLKMTDFGIKPPAPALAFGLLKTGDDVKVVFEWITAPAPSGGK
jgi:polyisoprenoid-binding protein YceI